MFIALDLISYSKKHLNGYCIGSKEVSVPVFVFFCPRGLVLEFKIWRLDGG